MLNQKLRTTSLSNESYERALGLGMISGSAVITAFGRVSVVATELMIAEDGIYGMPDTAETVLTQTTDPVNDTNAGDGAREFFITGINENDEIVSEFKPMDSPSVNSYKRILSCVVSKSGTVSPTGINGNYGEITVEQSVSSVPMVKIPINQGRSQNACLTIPKGYTGLIHYADTVSGEGKQCNVKLKVRDYNNTESPFLNIGERDTFENIVGRKFVIPSEVKEMNDIIFTGLSNASGADVSAVIVVELIENNKMGLK